MAIKITFICDLCGAEKKQANHWWLVHLLEIDGGKSFRVISWGEYVSQGSATRLYDKDWGPVEHLCGEACVIKRLSQWMSMPVQP